VQRDPRGRRRVDAVVVPALDHPDDGVGRGVAEVGAVVGRDGHQGAGVDVAGPEVGAAVDVARVVDLGRGAPGSGGEEQADEREGND
jgi:hypothetical protein